MSRLFAGWKYRKMPGAVIASINHEDGRTMSERIRDAMSSSDPVNTFLGDNVKIPVTFNSWFISVTPEANRFLTMEAMLIQPRVDGADWSMAMQVTLQNWGTNCYRCRFEVPKDDVEKAQDVAGLYIAAWIQGLTEDVVTILETLTKTEDIEEMTDALEKIVEYQAENGLVECADIPYEDHLDRDRPPAGDGEEDENDVFGGLDLDFEYDNEDEDGDEDEEIDEDGEEDE